MEHKIALAGVAKRYGTDVVAIEALSMEVRSNEIVCLLGPSGCGSLTVLNLIAGFEFPTTGTVALDGESVHQPGPDRGVVFQEHALFPWLTILENISFGRKLRNGREDPALYRESVHRYIAWMGLKGFEHRYPRSSRAACASAPPWRECSSTAQGMLLMDEPFAAVDAKTRLSMQMLLLDVWERLHTTILFITHDIDEAVFLGDRIYVMTARPGRIKEVIAVPLERPRSYDVVLSAAFNETKVQIFDLIREESAPLWEPC